MRRFRHSSGKHKESALISRRWLLGRSSTTVVVNDRKVQKVGKPVRCLGLSTVSSERQQRTHLCPAPAEPSEIPNRFVKHGFRAENSCLSWEAPVQRRKGFKCGNRLSIDCCIGTVSMSVNEQLAFHRATSTTQPCPAAACNCVPIGRILPFVLIRVNGDEPLIRRIDQVTNGLAFFCRSFSVACGGA
jgi:hypothetical protein